MNESKIRGRLKALAIPLMFALTVGVVAAAIDPLTNGPSSGDPQGPAGGRKVLYRAVGVSSINAGVDILSARITPALGASRIEVEISAATSRVFNYTVYDGVTTKTVALNGGTALTAGASTTLSWSVAGKSTGSVALTYNLQWSGGASAIDLIVVTECSGSSAKAPSGSGGGSSIPTPVSVANGGTGLSTWTAANRLIYSTAAGAVTTLAAGADTFVLTSAAGVPTWAAPGAASLNGFTNPVAGKLVVSAGAAGPHFQGPSDDDLQIVGGANQGVSIFGDAGGGGSIQINTTGAISLTASGSNKSITFTPTGTGEVFATNLNGSVLATGHVYRLPISYVSATTITVGPGNARSALDDANIVLTSTQTVDITATGSLGLNTLTSATTFTTAGSATITAASDVFAADLTAYRRTLTGTFATTTTTLTGTGSKLLSETSVGSVIRVGAEGAGRVTAIASDTSLTFVATLPDDGGSTGMTAYVNEGTTLKVGSETCFMVNTINNAGTTIVLSAAVAGSAGGQAAIWDAEVGTGQFLAVYAATISSNGRAFLSTHYSATPNAISGLTAYRRIGFVYNDGSGNIQPFKSCGSGATRTVTWEMDQAAGNLRVLSNGATTTWADVVCSGVAPPTGTTLMINANMSGGTITVLSVRPRGVSVGTGNAALNATRVVATDVGQVLNVPCDAAQVIQVHSNAGTTGGFLDAAGYVDEL